MMPRWSVPWCTLANGLNPSQNGLFHHVPTLMNC